MSELEPLETFGIAHVLYRESVDQAIDVDNIHFEYLKKFAFPLYFPQRFHVIPGFYGLKLSPLNEDKMYFSYFYYVGRTDDWNQPLLEAWVIVMEKSIYDIIGRDLIALKEYFSEYKHLTADKLKSSLLDYLYQKSAVLNDSQFKLIQNSAKIMDLEFLSEAISTIISHQKVSLLGGNLDLIEPTFRLITLFIPTRIITNRTLTTICNKPDAADREDIALMQIPEVEEVIKIPLPRINIEKNVVKQGSKFRIIERIINEAIMGEEWFGFSEREKFLLLIRIINAIINRKFQGIMKISRSLFLMRKTLSYVENFERNILKDKKELEKIIS